MNSERSAAAALLSDYEHPLPPNLGALVRFAPGSFSDERLGTIAEAVAAVSHAGTEVSKEHVVRWLDGRGRIDQAGGLLFVEVLAGESVGLQLAEGDAEQVFQQFEKRRAASVFADASEALEHSPDSVRAIVAGAAAALEGLRFDAISDRLTARRFCLQTRPPEPPSVYSLGETSICTPGNLTTIVAAAKAGNSAFLGAMLAAVLTKRPGDVDTFGLRASNPEGRALIHFDSEQSTFDHWTLVERSLIRARRDDAPPWLQSYCLTGFSPTETWATIRQTVTRLAKEFRGVHSVLIDGVADLCNDVNDPAESNALVAGLHDTAIEHDCPIVGILHLNPGTEKSRGHLGSQLERKSETNLRLEKTGEITTVWSEKQRRAPIFKDNGPKFRFDSEAGMHVTVKPEDDPALQNEIATLKEVRHDVFRGRASMRYCEMISTLKSTANCSEKTAERRVAKWIKHRLVEKSVAGLYTTTV